MQGAGNLGRQRHRHPFPYADLGVGKLCEKLVPNGVFTDVKSFYDPAALAAAGAKVWRL